MAVNAMASIVTCEIPPSLIKLAIREPEMSGHYFVRRSIITRIR